MKKLVLSVGIILCALSTFAQSATKKAEEMIKFKETTYNFGKIKKGVPVTHEFPFSNINDNPIVITNASASCGCTTPDWPKAAIMKDKSDKITAGFNAGAVGPFNKSIFVTVDGASAPVELKITGEVLDDKVYEEFQKTSAPAPSKKAVKQKTPTKKS